MKREEWLQWGHVFSDVETIDMGDIPATKPKLQWGHVFSDVETSNMAGFPSGITGLQWGHVFSDVETFDFSIMIIHYPCASMGPRLFRRGNHAVELIGVAEVRGFNGATSFQTWKRRKPAQA